MLISVIFAISFSNKLANTSDENVIQKNSVLSPVSLCVYFVLKI